MAFGVGGDGLEECERGVVGGVRPGEGGGEAPGGIGGGGGLADVPGVEVGEEMGGELGIAEVLNALVSRFDFGDESFRERVSELAHEVVHAGDAKAAEGGGVRDGSGEPAQRGGKMTRDEGGSGFH